MLIDCDNPFILRKPDLPRKRRVFFRPTTIRRLGSPYSETEPWGICSKRIILGVLEGSIKKITTSLVVKELKSPGEAFEYYQKWKKLKKFGIPTVESLRVIDDNTIAMTDLTAQDAKGYGKERINKWLLLNLGIGKYSFTPDDYRFSQIAYEDISQEVNKISDLATRNQILLAEDDPFDFFLYPDGSWQVLVLDLSQVYLREQHNLFDTEITAHNNRLAESFLYYLRKCQQMVVAPGLPSLVSG